MVTDKRPQLLRVTLRFDEEATRQLRCSHDEAVRRSVYINPDVTPAEIQLAYKQREQRRRQKARSEVSRPTGPFNCNCIRSSDHATFLQDDYVLNFPKLMATDGFDRRLS